MVLVTVCQYQIIIGKAPWKIDGEAAKAVVESAVVFLNGLAPTPNLLYVCLYVFYKSLYESLYVF